jgi:RNA polymerase primary sigma factor
MKPLVINKTITLRELDSLEKYFREIEGIAPIKPEEEVELAKKIRFGDHTALEKLTKANLRFVISVAKQFQNRGLMLGDLINEGNIGLMIAAKRYDETKGFKFISYAVWWIRQSIIIALAEHARTVRLPYNKLSQLSRISKATESLECKYHRKPTEGELSEHLGIPECKISEILGLSNNSQSLFMPRENAAISPIDVLEHPDAAPDNSVMFDSIKTEINNSLRILDQRDRAIIILYYGLSDLPALTLQDIGERFGISKEHTGRLKERALQRLKNSSCAPILQSCLQ